MGARRERVAFRLITRTWFGEIFSERGTPTPTQAGGGVPIGKLGGGDVVSKVLMENFVTVSVPVRFQCFRFLCRLAGTTRNHCKQEGATKLLATSGDSVVPCGSMLLSVARYNHLWEQDVGGSNPLAPTNCPDP